MRFTEWAYANVATKRLKHKTPRRVRMLMTTVVHSQRMSLYTPLEGAYCGLAHITVTHFPAGSSMAQLRKIRQQASLQDLGVVNRLTRLLRGHIVESLCGEVSYVQKQFVIGV
jgi:hypothetical protein